MQSLREKGLTSIVILVIVVVGVAIGGGVYFLSKKSSNLKLRVPGKGAGVVDQTVPGVETQPNSQVSPSQQVSPVVSQAQVNFTQKGNLSLHEDGSMYLVWDVPGNPAVNVQLKFTDQSTCLIGGKNNCALLKKFADGLAYCQIEGNRVSDLVTVQKLEELQLPL